jgi:hypothetical protein
MTKPRRGPGRYFAETLETELRNHRLRVEPEEQQASEMVERVARAMWQADPVSYHLAQEQMEAKARLAIAAMRVPTMDMLDAGDSMMPQIAKGQDISTGYDALKDAWPEMIDAALSGSSVGHQIQRVAPILSPAAVSDLANEERRPAPPQWPREGSP